MCVLDAGATGELVEKLEDSQMALGSMATNRYSAPFKDAVVEWTAKLSTVGDVVEMWLVVQNMWIYMEAVFSGGDIVKQLPQEAKRFNQIDKAFTKMVHQAVETLNVVSVCYGNDTILTLLPHLTDQLELCQKSLTAFLDTKRAAVPALLLRLRPHAAGDFVARVGARDGDAALPERALRLRDQRHLRQGGQVQDDGHVLAAGRVRSRRSTDWTSWWTIR